MKERGFTLLEVMVATVIMGIAVAGLIAGLSQSVKNASRLTDYDRAAMLARTEMNDLLLADLPFEGTLEGRFDAARSGGIPSGWRASVAPFEAPPNAGPGTMIVERVALAVWWQPASGTRREIQLETWRGARIPTPSGP